MNNICLFQTTASLFVQNALFELREKLLNWDKLDTVTINHHNTWKSKQCICDMISPLIENTGNRGNSEDVITV